ncbi:phosphoribosyltransferase family protein [Jidongwangia harbinensis]|uniref:phosphoribosyltransferase family protein n=1 Tax=Jidongwangia harbinensis TaxID=2878561 RepID=UPI001CDA38BC|nr:phosphoribosyltransferase family protein [Jidongwangia harbinensis]MCA2215562.1 ComF family protein [Jidongwangia harbinensis]
MTALAGALADLVLPGACAGCGAERVPLRFAVCADCAAALEALVPHPTAPEPPPAGLPPCTALGPYAGPLRGVLLGYKEKGRHRLAGPLGALLAAAVATAATRAGGGPGVPVVVVPVPSTARAVRERHGDHMSRLGRHAVRRLRRAGWRAQIRRPLRVTPRPDSASLDPAGRVAAAESSLRIRPARIRDLRRDPTIRRTLVVVDDIVTTGATLAAATTRLREANVQVAGAAVLAATRLRRTPPGDLRYLPPGGSASAFRHPIGSPNEG